MYTHVRPSNRFLLSERARGERASEGRASEGRASEGRASEGRASEGRASEGRARGHILNVSGTKIGLQIVSGHVSGIKSHQNDASNSLICSELLGICKIIFGGVFFMIFRYSREF